jgi:hypothetical protein
MLATNIWCGLLAMFDDVAMLVVLVLLFSIISDF